MSLRMISVPANALLDQSLRTSLITGHRPCISGGLTEVSRALTEPFPSNTFSTLANPLRSPITSECSPVVRFHDPRTNLALSRTKLSCASAHWLRPLAMILSLPSRARAVSVPKLYVPFPIFNFGNQLTSDRRSQVAGMEKLVSL